MLAFMPSESANSSPRASYWYGNDLHSGLDVVLPEGSNPRMLRRASEAMIHSQSFHSEKHAPWDHGHAALHIDTAGAATLALRPQPASATANQKAPLAPKQGLAGALGGSRAQYQSPIAGTYALRTPRGKITSIACESCRKRKSKCDGVRPKCNTCQTKNLPCIYDVAEDGKTTTQLRAHVRRLAKELDDMKSVLALLAVAPDRATAAGWASELEKNGFAHHSAEEIKRSLQDGQDIPHPLADYDTSSTPSSESFARPAQSLTASSFESSSREESREQSQPGLAFPPENPIESTLPFDYTGASDIAKFSFDCAFYRKTKREMLANGWDEAQIYGRTEIDVDTVLLGFMDPQDGQPVPTWAARTVNKVLVGAPVPIKLASTYSLTKMMKWLIWPSVEHMNVMPDWLMPLARQDCSPYDLLVDLIPWPQLRQYLYQHPGEFMAGAFVGFINITWPYADDACHYWDVQSGCTRMTPLFETHIRNLDNWTLDAKALELMPQLEGLVPVKV